MKMYFLGLIGLALASATPAMAQGPILQTNAPGSVIVDTQLPTTGQLFHHRDCGVTCVPEQYMKQKKTVCYGSVCDTICLCYYHGCRRGCDSGHCERPVSVKYLTKRTTTCECPATRCVPSCAPSCAPSCGPIGHGHVTFEPALPEVPMPGTRPAIFLPEPPPQR